MDFVYIIGGWLLVHLQKYKLIIWIVFIGLTGSEAVLSVCSESRQSTLSAQQQQRDIMWDLKDPMDPGVKVGKLSRYYY